MLINGARVLSDINQAHASEFVFQGTVGEDGVLALVNNTDYDLLVKHQLVEGVKAAAPSFKVWAKGETLTVTASAGARYYVAAASL